MDMKAQRFGIEVELTGITRKEAADIAAAYFGTSSRYLGAGYDTYAALDNQGRQWKFMVTLYAHCSKVYIRSGQTVQQGDVIAAVGSTGRSTGNHLHLEVRIGGKKVNPRQFLP